MFVSCVLAALFHISTWASLLLSKYGYGFIPSKQWTYTEYSPAYVIRIHRDSSFSLDARRRLLISLRFAALSLSR